jgi:hypothetical protein
LPLESMKATPASSTRLLPTASRSPIRLTASMPCPRGSQRRKAFDDAHPVAAPSQPEGQSLPGDSAACDKDPQGPHSRSFCHAHTPKSIGE